MEARELRIKDFFGYKIREDGVLYSKKSGREMKPFLNKKGYYQFCLSINGVDKTVRTHQAVAIAFIPNPQHKRTVNHKDFNKLNNHVSNLEWATQQEQIFHSLKGGKMHGHRKDLHGEKNPRAIITESQVREIRKLGKEKKLTMPQIGKMFNIHRFTASNIIHYRTWKNVV